MKINEKIAKEFTEYMTKYQNLYRNLALTIFNELNNNVKKPIILDLGSGPGLINKEIKNLLPNSIIVSLDSSLNMLKKGEKKDYKANIIQMNGILSVAEKIPLKDNSIDILVSRFSISYWKKPQNAILEIRRILKPNGKFILEALNKNFPKWKLALIKIHMMLNLAGKSVIKYHLDAYKNAYDFNQINNLLNDNGLKILKHEGKNKDWKYIIIAIK